MKNHKFKELPLALALGFAAMAQVQAQVFEGSITTQRAVGGTTVIDDDGPASAVSGLNAYGAPGYNPLASTGPSSRFQSNFLGDASTGNSFARAVNSGEDKAFVSDPATVSTLLTYSQMVTNTTGVAQNVTFDFLIPGSRVAINLDGSKFDTLDAKASFDGVISWGGVNLWNVNYDLEAFGTLGAATHFSSNLVKSSSASGFATTIFVPPSAAPGAAISGAAYVDSLTYNGLLNLGILNPGESRSLVYTLEAAAFYYYSNKTGFTNYGGVGAGMGDPFGIEFDPATSGITFSPAGVSNDVPEPGVLALAGVAGLGLWTTRRRRRALSDGPAGEATERCGPPGSM